MTRLVIFCLVLISAEVHSSLTVTEVKVGHLAELHCVIDDDHRFMFWHLTDNNIIGPGNAIDKNKYKYEVLTGKLYIRGVSTKEAGFYKCVSRGINDESSIKIHVVELVVTTDQNNIGNSSFETNLLRAMAVVMVIIVAIAVVLLIIIIRRKRSDRFFEMEESRENSPEKYTNNIQTIPIPQAAPGIVVTGIDNPGLDDFPKVFQHMQK